ncbi:LysM peptidoglycan-binding domain-containing protein [Liquorilactobacillus mali]|uniref:C40 family peptidase n=1 Tax=Liquorilactobacillus mali TaxID=1618 RepID=UPI00264A7298|nr:C40 family peptidase [Liquorilactobacillus mali]MDN7145669.1 LysM peptidoglycan-binding domain-containing protein [Liquorilactobacillus mali]
MKRTTKTLLASTVGAAGLFLASTTNASASTTVKVNKNDTVWDLSQKYGVSIKSIETLNNINENSHLIIESQTLTIPDSDSTSDTADSSSTSSSATSTVSVAKGDSLWAIAQKYGTTVDSLRSLNGLASTETLIKPGQTLKVDGSADTSSSDTNNESSTTTTESSTTTTTTTKSTATTTPSVTVSANHVTYTVKSGDSLYTIAQDYGVTVASLRSSNTLGSAILPGQTLTINDPTKTPSTTTTATESSDSSASSSSASTAASSSTTATASTASTAASSSTTAATTSSAATTASAANSSSASTTSSVAATPRVSSSTASSAASTTASTTASSTTSSTTSTASTSAAVSTSSVVSYATYLASLKIPYVYGGTSLSGFDCSGFVQYVYAHFGVSLPRTSQAQSTIGTAVPVSQAKAGDLLFWGSQGSSWHVGIYIGGTSYVAAPSTGQTVSVKSFQYFQPSFAIHMN